MHDLANFALFEAGQQFVGRFALRSVRYRRDRNMVGQQRGQYMFLSIRPETHALRQDLDQLDPHPHVQTFRRQLRINRFRFVFDMHNHRGNSNSVFCQMRSPVGSDISGLGGNRIPVRVVNGIPHLPVQQFDFLGRHIVLPTFRLAVPFRLRHPGLFRQIVFPKPVKSQYAKRIIPTLRCKPDTAAVGSGQSTGARTYQQVRRAAAWNPQHTRQALHRCDLLLICAVIDMLEQIFRKYALGQSSGLPPAPEITRVRPEQKPRNCQNDACAQQRMKGFNHSIFLLPAIIL